jgi:hypothetical protein
VAYWIDVGQSVSDSLDHQRPVSNQMALGICVRLAFGRFDASVLWTLAKLESDCRG